ncbi:hypothetical protein GCM10017687_86770 [Streptomyces echinatus]
MRPCRGRGHPAARGTGEQALPDQERLGDLLHGLPLLPHRDGEGGQADRSAAEQLQQRLQDRAVEAVEAAGVDLVDGEGGGRDLAGDHPVGLDLRIVADAAQQTVGDAGRAPGAAGDLGGAVRVDLDVQQVRRAVDDALQLVRFVELHVRGEAEAVAQRGRQQARARGGADQGERRQLQRDRGGAGALADDDVDAEVLHRHVEHLLGGPGHPVDLVEEEHLALLEGGEDRGEVAGVLDGGARGDADGGAHLGRDDHRQGGLAEPGRAGEQHVVGGGAPRACGAQDQVELFADLLLADELTQVLGAQGGLDGLVLPVGDGAHQPLLGGTDGPLLGGGVGRVVPSS